MNNIQQATTVIRRQAQTGKYGERSIAFLVIVSLDQFPERINNGRLAESHCGDGVESRRRIIFLQAGTETN
jgi:hypothetical protein